MMLETNIFVEGIHACDERSNVDFELALEFRYWIL